MGKEKARKAEAVRANDLYLIGGLMMPVYDFTPAKEKLGKFITLFRRK